LKRTELDSIPKIYEIWLIDKYKKDSLDLRADTVYTFNIDKSDTASFGSNRFIVVVRQNPALAVHLLDFNAVKSAGGADITWLTENEENYSQFTVQRSCDAGVTFTTLTNLTSSSVGNYSFLDKTPPVASDQYRLKMTDLNGTISYSNVITLMYGNSTNTISGNISVYPNPTNTLINLSINEGGYNSYAGISGTQGNTLTAPLVAGATTGAGLYKIKIINAMGEVIQTASTTTPTWLGNVGKLLPGSYIIMVTNSSNSQLVGRSTFVKL
jgi:hypothetical protein